MIEVADEGRLRIVTLNRPEKANALTREMLSALADTVERAAADPSVHVLVLTGRGKVFSAGAGLEAGPGWPPTVFGRGCREPLRMLRS